MPQDHSAAQRDDVIQDWPAVLNEHGVQFPALDRHTDSGLLSLFRSRPGWTTDFEDEEAAIFVRTGTVSLYGTQARTPDDGWVLAPLGGLDGDYR